MSESPSPSDRTLAPLLAAGVQVALVVASWGFTSLLLDRDVIADPAVGPLVGPIAVVVSGVVTALATRRAIAAGRLWRAAVAAGAVALLAMLVVLGSDRLWGMGIPRGCSGRLGRDDLAVHPARSAAGRSRRRRGLGPLASRSARSSVTLPLFDRAGVGDYS